MTLILDIIKKNKKNTTVKTIVDAFKYVLVRAHVFMCPVESVHISETVFPNAAVVSINTLKEHLFMWK